MPVFKRAVLYLARKKSRTAILLIILFVISVSSMISLSIGTAVDKECDNLQACLASSFSCTFDRQALVTQGWPPAEDFRYISDSDLENLASLEHVEQCYTYLTVFFASIWSDLDTGDEGYHNFLLEENLSPETIQYYEYMAQALDGNKFYGCFNSELHEYFRTGAFELIKGRHICDGDVQKVLISDELASRNGLDIGDSFNVKIIELSKESRDAWNSWNLEPGEFVDPPDGYTESYDLYGSVNLEIVGIYKINVVQSDLSRLSTTLISNTVFSDMHSAKLLNVIYDNLDDFDTVDIYSIDEWYKIVTIFVDKAENIDEVIEHVKNRNLINEKYFDFDIDTEAYDAVAGSLKVLHGVSIAVVAICTMACFIIAGLLSSMWTKTRRKEIGILISMGNSRKKILFQLFIEMIIVCIVSAILAVLAVSLILGPLGRLVNTAFSANAEAEQLIFYHDGYMNPVLDIRGSEPINLTYYLTVTPVAITAGILLFASLISVFASSFRIMKLRPRDIFSKW